MSVWKRFLKTILMGIMSFFIFSSAYAAFSWPQNLELDSSVQVGETLAEIPINVSATVDLDKKAANGIASLRIKDALKEVDTIDGVGSVKDAGVYKLNDAVGVYFIGKMTFGEYDKEKLSITEQLVKPPPSVNALPSLIRVSVASPLESQMMSLTGTIVLIRLSNGDIPPVINYPTLSLCYQGSKSDDGSSNFVDIVAGGGGSANITVHRTCSVYFSGTNVNFGTFKSNHPSGLLIGNLQTSINVQCIGTSSNETSTPIYLQIIPTDIPPDVIFSDDAIGLKKDGGDVSDSLVVKATLNEINTSNSTLCSTGEGVKLSEELMLASIDKDANSYNVLHSIYWSLCKLNEESLPIGTYTGSATLSITFN